MLLLIIIFILLLRFILILLFSKWFEPRSISSSCSVIVRVSVVLKRTVGDSDWRFDNLSGRHLQSHCDNVPSADGIYVINTIRWRFIITMTLKMTTAQVVETSVTVTNSSFQNYTHPDDHTTRTTNIIIIVAVVVVVVILIVSCSDGNLIPCYKNTLPLLIIVTTSENRYKFFFQQLNMHNECFVS